MPANLFWFDLLLNLQRLSERNDALAVRLHYSNGEVIGIVGVLGFVAKSAC